MQITKRPIVIKSEPTTGLLTDRYAVPPMAIMTPARILVLYVVLGVILGGCGIYEKLVEFAGAGATVPLTGFGYNLAKGVKEAMQEDGATGILTGGLKAAAGGITAAVFFGFLAAVIFHPQDKS